jgi:hypothetical protein
VSIGSWSRDRDSGKLGAMAESAESSDRELIERFLHTLDQIDDDSALAGCVELLDHALPSEGSSSWTKTRLLAFAVELTNLLARASVGASIDEVEDPDDGGEGDEQLRYYQGHAWHGREDPKAGFTGSINMVRVELPHTLPDPEGFVIKTAIGKVRANDHGIRKEGVINPVFSVERINAIYQQTWNDPRVVASRVELITGARVALVPIPRSPTFRFTPVSLFLAYDAKGLIFYVVQSAFFDGRPSKLYVAQHMNDVISVPSGYRPTPFAHENNHYRIELKMDGDEPQVLFGEMHLSKAAKYLTVRLRYERLPRPPSSNRPLRAQVIAFSRVCALEDWMSRPHFRRDPLEEALHELGLRLGKLLPWQRS